MASKKKFQKRMAGLWIQSQMMILETFGDFVFWRFQFLTVVLLRCGFIWTGKEHKLTLSKTNAHLPLSSLGRMMFWKETSYGTGRIWTKVLFIIKMSYKRGTLVQVHSKVILWNCSHTYASDSLSLPHFIRHSFIIDCNLDWLLFEVELFRKWICVVSCVSINIFFIF